MTAPPAAAATPVIVAATGAILTWQHAQAAAPAHCLVRIRTLRDANGIVTVVVASELRDNPRGRWINADFAGVANATTDQLLPAACDPNVVRWYAHFGAFSSYDDAGPETIEQVRLDRPGDRFVEPAPERYQLLTPAETTELAGVLHLESVDELLASWPWDIGVPAPRTAG